MPMPSRRPIVGRQLAAARQHVAAVRQVQTGDQLERAESAAVPIESRPLAQVGLNATAADEALRLRGELVTDDRLLADTRESQIATYLDSWKRRIEQVGTINFPNEARRRTMSGNPVLEVAIRADGHLEQVLVRRTSGHRELDQAAVGIVRLASPFDPFTARHARALPRAALSPTNGSSWTAGSATAPCGPRRPSWTILAAMADTYLTTSS